VIFTALPAPAIVNHSNAQKTIAPASPQLGRSIAKLLKSGA